MVKPLKLILLCSLFFVILSCDFFSQSLYPDYLETIRIRKNISSETGIIFSDSDSSEFKLEAGLFHHAQNDFLWLKLQHQQETSRYLFMLFNQELEKVLSFNSLDKPLPSSDLDFPHYRFGSFFLGKNRIFMESLLIEERTEYDLSFPKGLTLNNSPFFFHAYQLDMLNLKIDQYQGNTVDQKIYPIALEGEYLLKDIFMPRLAEIQDMKMAFLAMNSEKKQGMYFLNINLASLEGHLIEEDSTYLEWDKMKLCLSQFGNIAYSEETVILYNDQGKMLGKWNSHFDKNTLVLFSRFLHHYFIVDKDSILKGQTWW